jgi:hypothetical protein
MSEHSRGSIPDRRKRRFWVDPRFVIGLALVGASAVGVVVLVGANDSSVAVLVARSPLAPGDILQSDDLRTEQVRAGGVHDLYLAPGAVPSDGLVVTRAVAAGELVPVSALGATEAVDSTTVVLQLTSRLPETVVEGTRLDIWAARATSPGDFEPPAVIVQAAMVVRLVAEESLVGSTTGPAVEVLIPRASVASVLESVANGAALSAIPVDLPVRE